MNAWATTAARSIRCAAAATRLNLLVASQYRVNLVIWGVVNVLQAVVYLCVWQAVAVANGGTTGGYSVAGLAGYFIVMLVIREVLIGVSLIGEFAGYVRKGTLAIHLLRPAHPFAYVMGGMFAFRLQFAAIIPVIAVVLYVAFDAHVDLRIEALVGFLLLAPLIAASKLCCDMLVACAALWLTTIQGIRNIYMLVILLLGGQLAPLDLLPASMQAIAQVLPFYWMLGFPTELLIGRAEVGDLPVAFAVLGGWSIVLYLVLQPVWRAGTRAYEAVGQ